MTTFEAIERHERLVKDFLAKAMESDSDEDWQIWNSCYNTLGDLIKEYGRNYVRQKKIKILLSE